jgi:hypothetical protein
VLAGESREGDAAPPERDRPRLALGAASR